MNLIIWGPSAKLVSEDPQIQNDIIEMMHAGVHIEACKACADHYGVADKLEKLGVHVRFMGVALTQYLKGNEKVITL